MKKAQVDLLEAPIEVCILRDGKPLMTQVFQHTPIRFGRILDNDIVLPFESVSRHHCELRFANGRWTLEDLKSLNGVSVNGQRVSSATFDRQGSFDLKPVTVALRQVIPSPAPTPVAPTKTISNPNLEDTLSAVSGSDETLVGTDPRQQAAKRLHSEKPQVARSEYISTPQNQTLKKKPLLNLDATLLMGEMHPSIEKAKSRAVQITTMWHDVVMNVDEFLIGEDMIVEINGFFLRLGRVGRDRSEIRCPTGTSFVDRPGNESVLLPSAPATWMADHGIRFLARYTPQAKRSNPGVIPLIANELVDPLVASGVVHGALALAAATMNVKTPMPPKPQPERIAKIITAPLPKPKPMPTPPPMIVKAPPSPTPIPTPTATPIAKATPKPTPSPMKPSPTPKMEAKATPKPTPAPTPKLVKVKPAPIEKPSVKEVAKAKPSPKVERRIEPEVEIKTKAVAVKPTPTPKPFDASSVGALRALSLLTAPVSSNSSERIVVRKTAAAEDRAGGQEVAPAPSTAQMMKNLPMTETKVDRDASLSLPVPSKDAAYGTAGYSGKTGKRGVLGSVIGGATYTEISKTEGLTREQVMKVVQKHHAQIQQCYERSLMNDQGLAGRAEFEWEIGAGGAVAADSVKVKETTLKNADTLIDCVKKVFLAMKFPTAKNGATTTPTIGLPFGRL